MLEQVLGVPVGEGHQPGRRQGQHAEEDGGGRDVHGVDPPEEPHGDGGHDEGVAVEEHGALAGDVLAEVLEEELVLLAEALLAGDHRGVVRVRSCQESGVTYFQRLLSCAA